MPEQRSYIIHTIFFVKEIEPFEEIPKRNTHGQLGNKIIDDQWMRNILENTTTISKSDFRLYREARVPRLTEIDPKVLIEDVKTLLRMGIRRFDFVGGEVSRYGVGWLDVVEQIRSQGEGILISLYTNGWWLEQENFKAAGQSFTSVLAYLEELKRRGVSHVTFSLDGRGDLHDASRHQPGLFQKILRGLDHVKKAGMAPRVSLLIRPNGQMKKSYHSWRSLLPLFMILIRLPRPVNAPCGFRLIRPTPSAILSMSAMALGMTKSSTRFWMNSNMGCPAAISIG